MKLNALLFIYVVLYIIEKKQSKEYRNTNVIVNLDNIFYEIKVGVDIVQYCVKTMSLNYKFYKYEKCIISLIEK